MPLMTATTAMRNMTPIVTPSSVKKLFSFCARICDSARRMASMNGTLVSRLSECDALRERVASLVGGDAPVTEHDDPAGMRGDVRFVGYHDHRLALCGERLEHAHDLRRGSRIEVSRRLVGEENRRHVHECTCDRHALPLAARQLV